MITLHIDKATEYEALQAMCAAFGTRDKLLIALVSMDQLPVPPPLLPPPRPDDFAIVATTCRMIDPLNIAERTKVLRMINARYAP